MRQKESRRPSMRRLLFDPPAAERYPLADPNDSRVEANMIDLGASLPLLARAIVIGVLGGIALILIQLYSRRGPLIFPV